MKKRVMILDTELMTQILMDRIAGKPLRVEGREAEEFGKLLDPWIEMAKEKKWVIEIPGDVAVDEPEPGDEDYKPKPKKGESVKAKYVRVGVKFNEGGTGSGRKPGCKYGKDHGPDSGIERRKPLKELRLGQPKRKKILPDKTSSRKRKD